MVTRALTLAEIAGLPAVTDLVTAGRALGIGRTRAYELARAGQFPCPVIRAGGTWRVPDRRAARPSRPARPRPAPARRRARPPRLTGGGEPRVHAPASGFHGHARLACQAGAPAPQPPTEENLMSDGTTYKLCGCRDEGTGKRLGRKCPKLRRGNGWSHGHGTWYYQIELPPRADGRRRDPLRHGGFATDTDAKAELDLARELLAIAAPGDLPDGHPDRRRHHRRHARDPHAPRPRPGPQAGRRRRRPRRPPAHRGRVARGMADRQEEAPARHRPQLQRPHPPVPQAPPRAHPHRPAPGHRRLLDVRPRRGTQRRHRRGPRLRQPGRPRRRQGTPPDRPGHLPADPRHPPLGGQHLHEAAPRRAARQRRLPRRAAARHPAQGPGLDRRAGPGLAEGLRRPAGRRPRGRRAGQPGRHLGLRAPPVAGHGLDPRPDHGLPPRPPAATGCTRCGG